MSKTVINKLMTAAKNHGEDNLGHQDQVSDLESMLLSMWELMTPGQKVSFIEGDAVEAVIELGARDEYTAEDLVEDLGLSADGTSLVTAIEVQMQEVVGEYNVPEEVPEWAWVQKNASFSHNSNGKEDGVWEFLVHAESVSDDEDIPERLKKFFEMASAHEIAWVMFYQ